MDRYLLNASALAHSYRKRRLKKVNKYDFMIEPKPMETNTVQVEIFHFISFGSKTYRG